MYRDTVSESQPVKLTDKEFRALEELIYERLKPKHSTSPEANEDTGQLNALQGQVASIEQQLTDLTETVTQHKAEQDNLDKLGSPRHKLISRLAGVEDRLNDLTETLRPIKEEYDRYSFHDNTNVYARLNSMDKRIRNLASQTEGDE